MAWKDFSRLSNIQPFTAAHPPSCQSTGSTFFRVSRPFDVRAPHPFRPTRPRESRAHVHFDVFGCRKALNLRPTRRLFAKNKRKTTFLNCLVIQCVNYIRPNYVSLNSSHFRKFIQSATTLLTQSFARRLVSERACLPFPPPPFLVFFILSDSTQQ